MRAKRLVSILCCLAAAASCNRVTESVCEEYPPIYPDYCDVTVPKGIAPLNFSIPGEIISTVITSSDGEVLLKRSGKVAHFSIRRWHRLLEKYSELRVSVIAGKTRFKTFSIYVSEDSIDYGLTYRTIEPGYQGFGHMCIRERQLSNFRERILLDNKGIEGGCVNCHTPMRTDPSMYIMHIRGSHGATLLRKDGIVAALDTKTDSTIGAFVYPSWSPDGRYIAFSNNTTRQNFYSAGHKRIEVYDEASDVVVYDVAENRVLLSPSIMKDDVFETYPSFSEDGRTIYFCACDAGKMPEEYEHTRYGLCSIGFDPETGTFADKVDTLIRMDDLSFATPRASYDGKYIMLVGADFGTFPIWHKEADLYLYDIASGQLRPIEEINSDDTESFHNWSRNSRWVVFSSRRDDGLYTKLYLAHIGDDGHFSKPVLLPQRNPRKFYDLFLYSYNTPDFAKTRTPLPSRSVYRMLLSPDRVQVE